MQAISCRQDLEPNPLNRYPFGAIDGKVSSVQSVMSRAHPVIMARMGPSHDDQPPFCWAEFDANRNKRGGQFFHVGHPECFDFDWQVIPPPR